MFGNFLPKLFSRDNENANALVDEHRQPTSNVSTNNEANLPDIPDHSMWRDELDSPRPKRFGSRHDGTHYETVEGRNLMHNIRDVILQHHTLQTLRDDVLHLRTEFAQERRRYLDARWHAQNSQTTWLRRLQVASLDHDTSETRAVLASFVSQGKQDDEMLQQQGLAVDHVEQRLNRLEAKQSEVEATFVLALQELSIGEHQTLSPSANFTSTKGFTHSSLTSPELDPLLQRYWDRVGDVELHGQHLVEVDVAHQEAMAQRTFDQDHDRPHSQSSGEFEKEFQQIREDIVARIDAAILDAEQLRQACIKNGLDVRRRRLAISEASLDDIFPVIEQEMETVRITDSADLDAPVTAPQPRHPPREDVVNRIFAASATDMPDVFMGPEFDGIASPLPDIKLLQVATQRVATWQVQNNLAPNSERVSSAPPFADIEPKFPLQVDVDPRERSEDSVVSKGWVNVPRKMSGIMGIETNGMSLRS